ncbi:MAG: ABC transporter ATP-binding protein [Nakamurella sp.]
MAVMSASGLSFSYRGRRGTELFSGLSHSFEGGSVTAVTGPSGRGKSTLLYILGLMLRPTSGYVMIDGAAVSSNADASRSAYRATRLGFIFQDASLDPTRSILDSILEPALYAGQRKSELIERGHALLDEMGVLARADHRPGEISGGQAQRVAVCRALINDPAIILADEPTGNLDRKNAEIVLDAISRQASQDGRTVIIATHDDYVLSRVDEVLEL